MIMKAMTFGPHVLLVNLQADILDSVDADLRNTFGPGCQVSVYRRPPFQDHPRLQALRTPAPFDIVIFDVGSDAASMRSMNNALIPAWLSSDVWRDPGDAILFVVAPEEGMSAVMHCVRHYARLSGVKQDLDLDRIEFIVRDPTAWATRGPAAEIAEYWRPREPKQGFIDSIIELLRTAAY